MPNKNKAKGNNAERELALIFTKHFGGSWRRTATSGAITGKSNAWRAKTMSASQLLCATNDITPPDEYRNCAIESKAYKEFEFHHLFREEGNKTLNKWIEQVKESGIDMEKSFPLICFKPNRQGWFVCIWKEKITDFDLTKINHFSYIFNNESFEIFELEKFINSFTEDLKKKFA